MSRLPARRVGLTAPTGDDPPGNDRSLGLVAKTFGITLDTIDDVWIRCSTLYWIIRNVVHTRLLWILLTLIGLNSVLAAAGEAEAGLMPLATSFAKNAIQPTFIIGVFALAATAVHHTIGHPLAKRSSKEENRELVKNLVSVWVIVIIFGVLAYEALEGLRFFRLIGADDWFDACLLGQNCWMLVSLSKGIISSALVLLIYALKSHIQAKTKNWQNELSAPRYVALLAATLIGTGMCIAMLKRFIH